MRPETRDSGLLWDIVRHSRELHEYLGDVTPAAAYAADRRLQLVTERRLGIVGEAACKVSPAARVRYPDVPWPAIIAQRHVLVHDCGRIIQERLWTVATQHIPALLAQRVDVQPPPPADTAWERER